MFKSNPANTTVSFCVPHELPVQIGVVTIVKPLSPVRSFEQLSVKGRILVDGGELEGGELTIERYLCKSHRQLNSME